MALRYDEIYEICKDEEKLREWLSNLGLLGDFSGLCDKCHGGSMFMWKDASFSKDGF